MCCLATGELQSPARAGVPGADGVQRAGRRHGWWLFLLVAVALAVGSLLVLPRNIGYDPWSWLIWGREIGHLDLDTRHASTAVKPFPIFLDVLLAPAGAAAPLLWLVVARTGVLLALGLAFRVARRLGGTLAGVAAAACLALADQLLGNLLVAGLSEPLATAAVLGAVDSHLRARPRAALVWLVLAGLLRPEAWPAVIGYCLWLALRGGIWRRLLLVALAVWVPAVWFAIDWFGSGQLSRSAEAATHQSQGGPLLSAVPGLATLAETVPLMSVPVTVLFLLGTATAVRGWQRSGHPGPLLWLAGGALGWVLVDAVLAQGRLATGAPRYLLPGAGLACVVAGCCFADLARVVRRRLTGRLAPAVLALVVVVLCLPRLVHLAGEADTALAVGHRAEVLRARLPAAIALAGGRDAIVRCAPISTGMFQAPMLAWHLDVHLEAVRHLQPDVVSGTVIEAGERRPRALLRRFRQLAVPPRREKNDAWTVLSDCPPVAARR
jgi:hypothetical protein